MYPTLALIVVVWLVLTVIGQASIRALTRMRRWDPFGFLPSWHFFAPNPARFDTVILEQRCDPTSKDKFTDWVVTTSFYDERVWHAAVNPNRRIRKSMHDLQNAIANMADKFDAEAVCSSAPALALFRFVQGRAKAEVRPGARQYAIARIENARTAPDARVVFVTPIIEL